MDVAILGTAQTSKSVTQVIEDGYNSWLEIKLAEPLNVVAYVSGEAGTLDENARKFL